MTFMQCPQLGKVPSISYDLTIKCTQTGIILLTQQRFKIRYTGNKKSAVDINGNLYPSASELDKKKKIERLEKQGNKKTAQRRNAGRSNNFDIYAGQISEENTEPTKKTKENSYGVNKKEVRQRLLGFINTQ